ncbi:hypothetical protein ACFSM5_18540 [Lacibacterium aquatile]|uniref:Uncharacterized protein n=1 Tax=Lacibacterium aquatile TaxID=1168082 RepID=A0ABW5DWT5_9PROT
MTQISPKSIPTPDRKPDTPLGGDDLNIPFVPDEDPKDREPSPKTEGPLTPQRQH